MVIEVALGARSYPIVIEAGGLSGLGASMRQCLPRAVRCVLVTSDNVARHHLEAAIESLSAAGIAAQPIRIRDDEVDKSIEQWSWLVGQMLAMGMDRVTPVVALGGGIVGDIAGFAAATVLRGVPFVQVPTTLLAMVDSAVGGKTGVNTPHGKNLVGAFHQPTLVYAAMAVVQTLPDREMRCGLGEVVKHGVLADRVLFDLCAERASAIKERDRAVLAQLVERSCRVKAAVVAEDELEGGVRAVLNLGHTVGHAIETVLSGSEEAMPHGECVAIGMVAEARWAAARGDCAPDVPGEIQRVIDSLGLPSVAPVVSRTALMDALGFDKKFHHGKLRTAIVEAVGQVRLAEIETVEAMKMFHSIPGFRDA